MGRRDLVRSGDDLGIEEGNANWTAMGFSLSSGSLHHKAMKLLLVCSRAECAHLRGWWCPCTSLWNLWQLRSCRNWTQMRTLVGGGKDNNCYFTARWSYLANMVFLEYRESPGLCQFQSKSGRSGTGFPVSGLGMALCFERLVWTEFRCVLLICIDVLFI